MMKFIKDMFSENSEASSKRVAGIFALVNAVVFGYVALFKAVPQWVFEGLLMYSASILATTIVTSIFQKKSN